MGDSQQRRKFPLPSLRLGLRLTAIAVIVFGPIAAAARAVHAPERVRLGYVEVDPSTASGRAAHGVKEYLAGRDPAVDRLLPNGVGGTRFFEDLDGNLGMAFVHVPAVGISATVGGAGWPEATELHERAHLLYAFLPEEVSHLMARVPAAGPGEYAAKNGNEHLAEMAAAAWEVVAPPELLCVEGTPVERLRDWEIRVPGTAGFVAWYLRNLRRGDVESYGEVSRTAAVLAAPYQAESDAVWKAIEDRRLPSGEFQPWGHHTVRDYLEAWRAEAHASEHWFDRIGGYLLAPSLMALSIAGQ